MTLEDGSVIQVGLFTVLLYQTLRDAAASLTFTALHSTIAPLVKQQAIKIAGAPQPPQASGKDLGQPIARFLAKPR